MDYSGIILGAAEFLMQTKQTISPKDVFYCLVGEQRQNYRGKKREYSLNQISAILRKNGYCISERKPLGRSRYCPGNSRGV